MVGKPSPAAPGNPANPVAQALLSICAQPGLPTADPVELPVEVRAYLQSADRGAVQAVLVEALSRLHELAPPSGANSCAGG
ncbi:MAG: hypothetical protein AAF288_08625 [Planctomycetota bacterium]